ncbi:MAG: dioxygenase [Rhodocyclaceae bacterium]|nr:dioxygenase [Rhodocyclaceae bacterium]
MSESLPVLFVPHGAPTFALRPGEAGAALVRAAAGLPRPRAIVVVSPHWDTGSPTVGSAREPETIHDYWGFPAPLYDIRYPAPGDPALAGAVGGLLSRAGFEPRLDPVRGLDHGAWIPLRLMFPAADIPVVPVSIQGSLGPRHHFRLGEALAPLAEEGVLLVASGNLTHNLRDFQVASGNGSGTPDYVPRFADWIWDHIAAGDTDALLDYRQRAPDAVRAHPSEDHLLPLHVALGAAGRGCRAERLHQGVDSLVLAMDGYALWPAQGLENRGD